MFSVALRLNGLLERSIKRIENLAGQTDWQTRITVRHKSGNGILILFPIFFFPETSFFQDQQKLRLELSQQEMAFLCAKIMVYIQCFLNPCHTWMSVCPFNGTYKMFFFPFEQNHKISREQFAVHTKTDVGEQGIKLKLRRVESRD